jgi:hypothetical protein
MLEHDGDFMERRRNLGALEQRMVCEHEENDVVSKQPKSGDSYQGH